MSQDELLRSHTELRAALIIAARRIQKLTFGRKEDTIIPHLRQMLREARVVARKHGATTPRQSKNASAAGGSA